MYVPVWRRSAQQTNELRSAATAALIALRQTLAIVIADDDAAEYGVDLTDAASLANVSDALERFLACDASAHGSAWSRYGY